MSVLPKTIKKQRDLFRYSKQERSVMSFTNIVTLQLLASVFIKIKSTDVYNCFFPHYILIVNQ